MEYMTDPNLREFFLIRGSGARGAGGGGGGGGARTIIHTVACTDVRNYEYDAPALAVH